MTVWPKILYTGNCIWWFCQNLVLADFCFKNRQSTKFKYPPAFPAIWYFSHCVCLKPLVSLIS